MNSLTDTDNFLSFLLSLQKIDPMTVLSVFLLTLARIAPIVSIAPFFGAKNIRGTIKMMFAVAFCAIFVPQNLLLIQGDIPYGMVFIGYFCKELLIGSVLGFIATVPFYIATSTGTLIDHSRGSSALQVTDPSTQIQTSPIGILYNSILIVTFFTFGGHFIFFDALARSYQLIPVDSLISGAFFSLTAPFWSQAIPLLQKMMDLTLRLAAPAIIGMLLTDLFLGIANRLAPQVQIVFLGIPLKSWVGIALMTASWALLLQVLGKETVGWFKALQQIINQASMEVSK